jgi:hypothetical protein
VTATILASQCLLIPCKTLYHGHATRLPARYATPKRVLLIMSFKLIVINFTVLQTSTDNEGQFVW